MNVGSIRKEAYGGGHGRVFMLREAMLQDLGIIKLLWWSYKNLMVAAAIGIASRSFRINK